MLIVARMQELKYDLDLKPRTIEKSLYFLGKILQKLLPFRTKGVTYISLRNPASSSSFPVVQKVFSQRRIDKMGLKCISLRNSATSSSYSAVKIFIS